MSEKFWHDHAVDWMNKAKELESERDHYKKLFNDLAGNTILLEVKWLDALKEIDMLKAELEKEIKFNGNVLDIRMHELAKDRDLWKSKAEKLVEALSNMLGWQSLAPFTIQEQAKAVLEDYGSK